MCIQDIKNLPYLSFDQKKVEYENINEENDEIEEIGISNLMPYNDMTREEIGISEKKIIVPSFNTTTKVFKRHF